MGRLLIRFIFIQGLIYKVTSAYAQPTIQQYVHLTGRPQTVTIPASSANQATRTNIAITNQARPSTGLSSIPALALPNFVSNLPINQRQISNELTSLPAFALSNLVSNLPISQTRPTFDLNTSLPPGLPPYSALGIPNLVSNLQQFPGQAKTQIKTGNPSSIDSNLLNNLAVALQLLIISNILNSPLPDAGSKPGSEVKACTNPSQNPYPKFETAMPNANFVGNSGYSEPVITQNHKPSRNSMSLLSPYEALGPISPYSEPVPKFSSPNPRQNFMSPYTMMDKDLFSMDNLF